MVQRPLVGEPLAVDLVNTRWRTPGGDVDLLDSAAGFAQWLEESGQDVASASEAARAAARDAREAIRNMIAADDVGAPGAGGTAAARTAAENAINGILARGLTVRRIEHGETLERVMMTGAEWTVAWRAVANYAELRAARGAIRQCGHPDCVLYFFDPTGRRRWCSMAGCGNRAKAKRHYARRASRAGGDVPATAN